MSANRNVWPAAVLQAKNESDIVGLRECIRPLCELLLWPLMECAALLSYLITQAFKPFPVFRFQERRVRPLCHRHGSPANLAGIKELFSAAAGLWLWESQMRFPSLASLARRQLQASCFKLRQFQSKTEGD